MILMLGWAGFGFGASARERLPDASEPQYLAISERNVFGLRPPPTQPEATNPPAQVQKITLTGITTILGNKRALMKVLPALLKPGETAKELSLILTEGQRESDIEVLQIDEKVGSVIVNNSGAVMTLTFEKDGAKLPAAQPGAPSLPGLQPNPAGGRPNPFALPANSGLRRFPGRNPRTPGLADNTVPGVNSPPSVGTPPLTAAQPVANGIASIPTQDLTAEEQTIIMELQRQANAANPTFPPLPPTALTPPGADGTIPVANSGDAVPAPTAPRVLIPQ